MNTAQQQGGMEIKNISIWWYDFGPALNAEQQIELDDLNSQEPFDWKIFDKLTEWNTKIVTKILDHPNYQNDDIQLNAEEQKEYDHISSQEEFDWDKFDRLMKQK